MQKDRIAGCLEVAGELEELRGSGTVPGVTYQVARLEIVFSVARHVKNDKRRFAKRVDKIGRSSLVLGGSALGSRDRLGTKEDGFRQLSEVPVVRKSKVCSGPPDTP